MTLAGAGRALKAGPDLSYNPEFPGRAGETSRRGK
jgi:hypothetical protein